MENSKSDKGERAGGNREAQRKEDQDRYEKFKEEKDPKNNKGKK